MYNLPKNAPLGKEVKFQGITHLMTPRGWGQFNMSDSDDRKDYEVVKDEIKSIEDQGDRARRRAVRIIRSYLRSCSC